MACTSDLRLVLSLRPSPHRASDFFYQAEVTSNRPWFFSFAFLVATVSIASGCLAERTNLVVYPLYTAALSCIVHPLAAHWVWTPVSWLNNVSSQCKVLDFAGGTVVHLVGGLTGLVGAALCGPRLGRFDADADRNKSYGGHDMAFVTLGTFMLWFGWCELTPRVNTPPSGLVVALAACCPCPSPDPGWNKHVPE